MVTKQQCTDSTYQFEIRPNSSLSWRSTVVMFCIISAVALIIASGFALIGAWMIFPFAGLEITVLAVVFYYCAQCNSQCEFVVVDEENITITRGRHWPEEEHAFQRSWARVRHDPSGHDWYPGRLVIHSHGREVEVGRCLTEKERSELAGQLAIAIA